MVPSEASSTLDAGHDRNSGRKGEEILKPIPDRNKSPPPTSNSHAGIFGRPPSEDLSVIQN
ncbi:hypothetical protein TWF696_002678 [Orbilia brochopaga]|uniref:Uncharacterized protein n=1 Tax=Orbilia brochopaga TaxID=3140254 RepID=A0AAV9U2E5_9PEZI